MAAGEARVEEARVVVVDHPLVQHKLSLMRSRDTHTAAFRALAREATVLMAYEVTRDLPVTLTTIETPLETMEAPLLDGKKVVLVGILRAGIGMLDGMLEVMPSARVGHIGLYRDPKTLEAVEYYVKLPGNLEDRDLLVVDPMLATANTAVAAVGRLKERSPRSLKLVCLLAAPEGLESFHSAHPDVPVFVGAVDRQLNAKGYILPGLGDAGDRLFGTR